MPDPLGRPIRIQRRRTRGWRMPAGAVYVGRPTRWGNMWTPKSYLDATGSRIASPETVMKICVDAYRAWLFGEAHWAHGALPPVPDLAPLRGRDLVCWCRLDQPCHADVLLEVVNR